MAAQKLSAKIAPRDSPRTTWAYKAPASTSWMNGLAIAWWKQYSLPVVIVRLFNTVGPRQTGRYGMVIPNFIEEALAGRPIAVYGSGNQSRSFAYVGDIVAAIVGLSEEESAVGEIFSTAPPSIVPD